MVTQGIDVVVYAGRYFSHYRSSDAYPSSAGVGLLHEIPRDLDGYKTWLSQKREYYAEMTVLLEKHALCVNYHAINEAAARLCYGNEDEDEGEDEGEDEDQWDCIDFQHDWDQMPVLLLDPEHCRGIEYTYIIDLDEQLFILNQWIKFHLWDLPRGKWAKPVTIALEEGILESEDCPQAVLDRTSATCFKDDDERDEYVEKYTGYTVTAVEVHETPSRMEKTCLAHVLALAVFDIFTNPAKVQLWDYLSVYDNGSFAFRELAFTLLSLAAGKVRYETLSQLDGSTDSRTNNGYLVGLDGVGKPQMFSILGSGCHLPGYEPGSSSDETMFCLDGVVVSLVLDEDLRNDTEAVVAQVVTYGCKLKKKVFSAIIFSMDHAITMEVDARDNKIQIQLGQRLRIIPAGLRSKELPHSGLEQLQQRHSGFVALQDFFGVHAQKRLPQCSQGVFPDEIYSMILAYTDSVTLRICGQVSSRFYGLCLAYFPFSTSYTLTKFKPSHGEDGKDAAKPPRRKDLHELGSFTFLSHDIGKSVDSVLDVPSQRLHVEPYVQEWCPVIGDPERQTIVTQARLRLLFK